MVANATGLRSGGITLNGTTTLVGHDMNNQGGSADTALVLSKVVALAAGDYITTNMYQTSGGALNTTNSSGYVYFQAIYLGA